jgi:hypothetical protein
MKLTKTTKLNKYRYTDMEALRAVPILRALKTALVASYLLIDMLKGSHKRYRGATPGPLAVDLYSWSRKFFKRLLKLSKISFILLYSAL